jgi:alpha-beta hydrolase superfamily lysophospholipase
MSTTAGTLVTEVQRSILVATDGRKILLDYWPAADSAEPVAVVQILHGLAEHPSRYGRFATACNARGYAVFAHNHRGHGENCAEEDLGFFAEKRGWELLVSDTGTVQQDIRRRFPDVPLVLVGHSMGSYLAQDFLSQQPLSANALVLSGSSLPSAAQLVPGHWIARFIAWRFGARATSDLLNRLGFGEFNKRFAPNRTEFDWLSRDEAEVDRYVTDALCGFDSSNGLWIDLTGALMRIRKRSTSRKIPSGLPVLITGGEHDPVGGKKGMSALADAYRASGHDKLTLKVYADGRHEMLNETNRDEFTADVLAWIAANV